LEFIKRLYQWLALGAGLNDCIWSRLSGLINV